MPPGRVGCCECTAEPVVGHFGAGYGVQQGGRDGGDQGAGAGGRGARGAGRSADRGGAMRLAGKVALISGGARGMGAVEARLFAGERAKVVLGDVLDAEGRAVEAEIRKAGGAAVRLPTKATAIQYAKDGIRANSVHPGPIVTPMTEARRKDPEAFALTVSRIPLGRYGAPEEVAYGVLYLACDESSFVTGAELVIDGGWTAQ